MRVLLAIDGSTESMEAATLLARLPFREKPFVTVLTVMEDQAAIEFPIDWSETEQKVADERFENVQSIIGGTSAKSSFVTKRGHPSSNIVNVAKEIDADLVVMGARGHSALYRVMLGSTANYVANHAQCSVLVVRPGAEQQESTDFRVMLAYDGSDFSKTASRQMFELAWPKETANIHIAMMLPRPKIVPEDTASDPAAVANASKALPKLSDKSFCQCDIIYNVRETLHAGSALWDLTESKNTSLLFVGAAGKSALARFFLGSTSNYLLNHVTCSVWIARTKRWE